MMDPSAPFQPPPATQRDPLLARIQALEEHARQLQQENERMHAHLAGERGRAQEALRASEEQLRMAAAAAELGTWRHDLSADLFYLDERAQQHYALGAISPPDALMERVHPDDRARLGGEIGAALDPAVRARVSTEYRVVHPDGAVRWLRIQGRVEFDGDGRGARATQGFGTVQDVTGRKEAEVALRESEARYRRLFDSIDEGFCVVTMIFDDAENPVDYVFLEANPAFSKQTGLTGAVGRSARELLPDLEDEWFRIYGEVARTGRPIRFQNGSEAMHRWFDVFAFRVDEPEQRRVAILFTDVTEHIRADRERERLLGETEAARAEADAANRAKSDFLASMSHELRTPLNAIGGYVDLLDLGIYGSLSDAQRTSLARIGANQRHLLTLINDILSFAQLEAGRIEFDVRPLSAMELIASVESLVAPQAAARGVSYAAEPCDPALCLRGDAERMRQILLNLVGNAIKFTPAGGRVVLSCDADGRWVHLRVRDTGVGIAPEEQERIFDPFQQVGRRLSSPTEGVGLGLAISRDLARAMEGELSVDSTPGEGSTFTVRLPRG
ncbi:PAS domain-containing sensor histidine kinase [Longimicrobium sp.]|uniref:PAS domain-containing sensor histidine kinase n=1 Tax=Longimicrobium sp. TaxID=2029185 RepID=UPI002F95C2C1